MNYNAVILAGVFAITGIWWVVHAVKHYPGPKVMTLYIHDDLVGVNGTTPLPTGEFSTSKEKGQ